MVDRLDAITTAAITDSDGYKNNSKKYRPAVNIPLRMALASTSTQGRLYSWFAIWINTPAIDPAAISKPTISHSCN